MRDRIRVPHARHWQPLSPVQCSTKMEAVHWGGQGVVLLEACTRAGRLRSDPGDDQRFRGQILEPRTGRTSGPPALRPRIEGRDRGRSANPKIDVWHKCRRFSFPKCTIDCQVHTKAHFGPCDQYSSEGALQMVMDVICSR